MNSGPTALTAKSAFAGDKLYQRRGRKALPILVRHAVASAPITYGQLARELDMSNPRNGNFVLGSVGRAVVEYGHEHGLDVPPLTTIVVNQSTELPSEGVAEFLEGPEEYLGATWEGKRRIIDRLYEQMASFEGWDRMLRRMGLEPHESLLSRPVRRGGGPEGEAHRRLKEYVASHPESVGLGRGMGRGAVEALLLSGDKVDVLFRRGQHVVGVEVKASDAPESDIERGLYQCIKYSAVLQATQRATPAKPSAETRLALGGELPERLIPLKHVLGIAIYENVGPRMDSR